MTHEDLQDLVAAGNTVSNKLATDLRFHDAGVVRALVVIVERTNASALAAAAPVVAATPEKKAPGKRGPDTRPRRKRGDAAADAAAADGKQVTVDEAIAAKGTAPAEGGAK